ncbi:Pyridoxine 4-oxidase [Armadillidium nasatum]|uniref:Pyridoxine 4-oxidase n=1 Tax=Armadillidium nasatum TaxID=96803 RepID=A0A5N5SP05_9CRUS|nr:Pyridoxine 4-oxidase [Armadillidium nasatum]
MITILGAGSAGAVIASRLSENEKFKVLLLEAGGNEDEISETPLFAPLLYGSEKDWKYKNERTPGACLGIKDQACLHPRGKVLGGSSTINGMLYVRGNKRDFDGWANLGNYGWSYEEVLPYFKKSEDNKNPEYAQNERYHSTKGELTVSDISFKTPLADIYVRAGQELGYRIGDYNAEKQTVLKYNKKVICLIQVIKVEFADIHLNIVNN